MRRILRRGVTLLAIYAVALNIIFLGLSPLGASAVDPFSVICHSVTTQGDEAPQSGLIPGHACEHCNLCSAVAPPAAPDVALALDLGPARILHLLRPASAAPRIGVTSDPKLARGPPRFV
jgi:hypothetical protein